MVEVQAVIYLIQSVVASHLRFRYESNTLNALYTSDYNQNPNEPYDTFASYVCILSALIIMIECALNIQRAKHMINSPQKWEKAQTHIHANSASSIQLILVSFMLKYVEAIIDTPFSTHKMIWTAEYLLGT